jgi:hypothetical protein
MHDHYEHLKCGDIKGLLEVLHQRMTDRIKDEKQTMTHINITQNTKD